MTLRLKQFYWVGAALLTASVVFWIFSARSARQTEYAIAHVRQETTMARKVVGQIKDRLAAATRTRLELESEHKRVETGASARAKSTAAEKPATPKTMTELIAHDPKAEVAMLNWQRAVVSRVHGPLFRKLGLTAEQMRKFEDIWVQREERRIDLAAAARSQTDAAGKETVARLQQKAAEDFAAAQATVLGAEGYRQWQEFDRTVVVRNAVVLGLAGAAALEGIPLTAQQGEQLWQAALAATAQNPTLKGLDLAAAIDWTTLDSLAGPILSAEQFELFKSLAPPSGFSSRWRFEFEAAIKRAKEADRSVSVPVPRGNAPR